MSVQLGEGSSVIELDRAPEAVRALYALVIKEVTKACGAKAAELGPVQQRLDVGRRSRFLGISYGKKKPDEMVTCFSAVVKPCAIMVDMGRLVQACVAKGLVVLHTVEMKDGQPVNNGNYQMAYSEVLFNEKFQCVVSEERLVNPSDIGAVKMVKKFAEKHNYLQMDQG